MPLGTPMTIRGRTRKPPIVYPPDEIGEHLLGDLEVGDDAVLQRPDRDDMAWRATEHFLGLAAHRFDLLGLLVDGND